MKSHFILNALFLYASACLGQINDDFSDGEFTSNPVWDPNNVAHWTIDGNQLRSNSEITSSIFYITTSLTSLPAQWEFFLNLKFKTSSLNYVDVFLVSESDDLMNASNNGYFIRIGGASDEVAFYKLQSGTPTLLIDGEDGLTNNSNNTLQIKMTRDASALWTLEVDPADFGSSYERVGTVTDDAISTNQYFGFLVKQSTASFFGKHYFDNIYAGDIKLESNPPVLSAVEVLSQNELELIFNEKLIEETAEAAVNYLASNGMGNPVTATLQDDEVTVRLVFETPFENGVVNQLNVSGVQDLVGNEMEIYQTDFLFFQPVASKGKDIVITEISPDPTPMVGLPEAEFIEILNRSDDPFDLLNWEFSDGNSVTILPSQIILPKQYLILTASGNIADFLPYGDVLGLTNFPTLNNGADNLTLRNELGILIDAVSYSSDWYQDEDKQSGGWTLELIDPNNTCAEQENWAASQGLDGGTPGKQNSIYANNPDLTGPILVDVLVPQKDTLLLVFNEKLEQTVLPNNFSIEPEINIQSASFANSSLTQILLKLGAPLETQTEYLLLVSNLHDCSGNLIQESVSQKNFTPPGFDGQPPAVQNIQVHSQKELSIHFNENISIEDAEEIENYIVVGEVGSPVIATLQDDETTVHLLFESAFENGVSQTLQVSGITDLVGNKMESSSIEFLYFHSTPTKKKEVIMTEVFPDPQPQVGLPSDEFLEIHNRSENPIDLVNWKISDETSIAVLPSYILLPNEYLILTAIDHASDFISYGSVLGVANFPTLNNNHDIITIRSAENVLIDSINYTLEWYRDHDKQEGGWTIELIDLNNACGEQDNWAASEDANGGTPGKQNSIFANKPDLTGPVLESVTPQEPDLLVLLFNEKLDQKAPQASFSIFPVIEITSAAFTNTALTKISLSLERPLAPKTSYTLDVVNLKDCAGNQIDENVSLLTFVLPEPADSLDLVINEVLFNPRPSAVDFVELFNASDKYLNVKDWSLAHYNDNSVTDHTRISSHDLIIEPKTYVVFTEDPNILLQQYSSAVESTLIKTDLPSLPDEEGSIALVSSDGNIIDFFVYADDYHSPLLKDDEGVSLERISTTASTNDPQNWRSANSSTGFATPGYLNSNARPEATVDQGEVVLNPVVFSPMVSPFNFTTINYHFEQSGLASNIKILDQQGNLIKQIANNQTLGHEGNFQWNGDRDDGSRARPGYYIVWFEVFNLEGRVTTYRKRVVIVAL